MSAADVGVFLNGSYGVGKSSVLDHLGDTFAAAGMPFSLFDVDWFHRSWPAAKDHPRNVLTEAQNMRAAWENYERVGPRTPIVAGVIASDEDRERYERVFGRRLRIVHLVASPPVAEQRLRGRYTPERAAALDWHLARHEQLAAQLATGTWNEATVETDDRSPAEVASIVFELVAPGLRGQTTCELTGRRRGGAGSVLGGRGVDVGGGVDGSGRVAVAGAQRSAARPGRPRSPEKIGAASARDGSSRSRLDSQSRCDEWLPTGRGRG